MRRPFTLILLLAALAGSIAVPTLHAGDSAAPAGQVPACSAAQTPQAAPAGSAEPALGTAVLPPLYAATCTPSPLCPGSACDADCKHRGARFGFCTAEQCCACFWKI